MNGLRIDGIISNDGYLSQDPRASNWRVSAQKAIPNLIPSYDSLLADESGISELLNLAWGFHEIIDQNLTEMFDFMKSMEI